MPLKLVLFVITAILPLCAKSQDSLATISLPRFQVWRLIHQAQRLEACDSLVAGLEREVDLASDGMVKASAVLEVMEKRLKLAEEAQRIQGQRVVNAVGENLELRKELRKQKRLKWLGIGGGLLLVILL